jgi:hypothetical protein
MIFFWEGAVLDEVFNGEWLLDLVHEALEFSVPA